MSLSSIDIYRQCNVNFRKYDCSLLIPNQILWAQVDHWWNHDLWLFNVHDKTFNVHISNVHIDSWCHRDIGTGLLHVFSLTVHAQFKVCFWLCHHGSWLWFLLTFPIQDFWHFLLLLDQCTFIIANGNAFMTSNFTYLLFLYVVVELCSCSGVQTVIGIFSTTRRSWNAIWNWTLDPSISTAACYPRVKRRRWSFV